MHCLCVCVYMNLDKATCANLNKVYVCVCVNMTVFVDERHAVDAG